MKFILGLMIIAALASPAGAAECRSVRGHLNGEPVKATRTVALKGKRITVTGTMAGKTMPRRSLPCLKLANGVLCEISFDYVVVSIMTNGKRMVEIVADEASKRELAKLSYVCNAEIKMP
jgi:hypothetical protein